MPAGVRPGEQKAALAAGDRHLGRGRTRPLATARGPERFMSAGGAGESCNAGSSPGWQTLEDEHFRFEHPAACCEEEASAPRRRGHPLLAGRCARGPRRSLSVRAGLQCSIFLSRPAPLL